MPIAQQPRRTAAQRRKQVEGQIRIPVGNGPTSGRWKPGPEQILRRAQREARKREPKTLAAYRRMFDRVPVSEWGGGDVSISHRLPDGRRIWLYGDTMSEKNGLVRNSALVQSGSTLRASRKGKQLLPNGGVDPEDPKRSIVYWPDGIRQGRDKNTVIVTSMEMSVGPPGDPWDFQQRKTGSSRAAVMKVNERGDLRFVRWQGYVPTPTKNNPHLAGDFMDHGNGHYSYGTVTHDIRLKNGKYLTTRSHNHTDSWDNHRNPDGSFRFKDWRPTFGEATARPTYDAALHSYALQPEQVRVPKGNGERSGRWVDMPATVLSGIPVKESALSVDLQPATPESRAAFKEKHGVSIPPAWTDVMIDLGEGAELVARGKAANGKGVYLYSSEYEAKQAARKYERLTQVFEKIPAIDDALSDIENDPTAAVARLMYLEGIRVGSSTKQQGKVMAYGAATLLTEHASVLPNGNVRLAFTAKEGIPAEYEIDDPALVAFITKRLEETKGEPGSTALFNTSSDKTIQYLRSISGLPGMKNHDLRTLLANRIAAAEVAKRLPPAPTTKKEAMALRKQIAEIVAQQLRNKPAQALSSYINPAVFAPLMEVA